MKPSLSSSALSRDGQESGATRTTFQAVGLPSVADITGNSGMPLDRSMRTRLEDRFSHSFSTIRIHGTGLRESPTGPAESEAERVAEATARSGHENAAPTLSRADAAGAIDFSHVRLHTGLEAAASAQLIGAQAYTSGSHIVFDDTLAAPHSGEGQRTLAHELAHVVQQVGPRPSQSGLPVPADARSVARRESYPKLHEDVLKELIAVARTHKTDGPERIPDLTRIAESIPEPDRPGLVERLQKPAKQDAFTDYVRNTFPSTRDQFLTALGAPPRPSEAAASGRNKGFSALTNARSKPEYIDNGIERIRYDGETAEIFYRDGAHLVLGLVPETIKPPFKGVNYRSARGEQATLEPTSPGTIRKVPQVRRLAPPGTSAADVMKIMEQRARIIDFVVEPTSQRIVPTEVNALTAPLLCKTLVKAEQEAEALAKATSEGGVKVFKVFELILEIAGFMVNPGESKAAAAAEKLTPEAAGMMAIFRSMRAKLATALRAALKEGSVITEVVAEGVSFGTVKPTLEAGAVTVRYAFIRNVGRRAMHGRMAQWALEAAARDVARAEGAKVAQVIVEGPIVDTWKAYLESIGYEWSAEVLPAGMRKVLSL